MTADIIPAEDRLSISPPVSALSLFGSVLGNAVQCTSTSLRFPEGTEDGDWVGVGQILAAQTDYTSRSLPWYVGDWMIHGEDVVGEEASQEFDPERWDEKTLLNCRWVASRIDPPRRRPELSFSHHAEVAKLLPSIQDRLLSRAVDEGLSRDAFREAVRAERKVERPETELPLLNAPSSLTVVLTVAGLELAFQHLEAEQQTELVERLVQDRDIPAIPTEFAPLAVASPGLRESFLCALPVSVLLAAAQKRIPQDEGVPPPYVFKTEQLRRWMVKYEALHPEDAGTEDAGTGDVGDEEAADGDAGYIPVGGDYDDDAPVPFLLTEQGRDALRVSALPVEALGAGKAVDIALGLEPDAFADFTGESA